MSTYYLTGPMSNLPFFNFPAFDNAAAALRGRGYELIVPSEQDSPQMQAFCRASLDGKWLDGNISGETWGDVLAKDVKTVADKVDGLFLLPGWEHSRGSRLECYAGVLCDKKFALYRPYLIGPNDDGITWVTEQYIRRFL
jgi:hypothetical protein